MEEVALGQPNLYVFSYFTGVGSKFLLQIQIITQIKTRSLSTCSETPAFNLTTSGHLWQIQLSSYNMSALSSYSLSAL
jgi:hypothetical protein